MDDAMVTSRMSRGKKELGAAALEKLGRTPSQAINQLYDYLIAHGELPFNDAGQSRESISPERLAEARAWLYGIALPEGNRFATMTDEQIRRERLAARDTM